jgi:hypothetical protein
MATHMGQEKIMDILMGVMIMVTHMERKRIK